MKHILKKCFLLAQFLLAIIFLLIFFLDNFYYTTSYANSLARLKKMEEMKKNGIQNISFNEKILDQTIIESAEISVNNSRMIGRISSLGMMFSFLVMVFSIITIKHERGKRRLCQAGEGKSHENRGRTR